MKNIKKKPCIKIITTAVILVLLVLASANASQPESAIYPAKGQSLEQQQKDVIDCQQSAMEKTGHDPNKKPIPPVQMKTSVGGQAVKGAAGGGLVGAGIGAIAGNVGAGVAIGAGAGAAVLGVKESKTQEQRDAEYKQYLEKYNTDVETYNTEVETYNKALGACLEGRGYTVRR